MTDIKEIAKIIRKQLKQEFPKCKFSVRIERYSMGQSMTIALMAAPFETFASNTDVNGYERERDYAQLNEYQLRRDPEGYICNGTYLTPNAWDVMKRVDEIQGKYNWDRSEHLTDYYNVNYYFHAQIGQWNKNFEVAS